MRFIVDAQLPPALARYLASQGFDAEHVFDLGMNAAEDGEIWKYALNAGAAIITKDEDFAVRSTMIERGPTIVWIRIGNASKQALLNWFGPMLPAIEQAVTAGERLIEIV